LEKMQARNLSDLVRASMLIGLHREPEEDGPAGVAATADTDGPRSR
jgi:hypothetical protein